MALQLTLSCDSDKTENGPTLIHSTGVQDYKIPPEVIRILQESLSNDQLSDHEQGVLCQVGPHRVLDVLRQNGFSEQNQTNSGQKTLWTVVQNGGGGGEHPVPPPPHNPDSSANDENEADGEGEEQGGEDDDGENKDGEEEEEEEEE